MIKNLLSIVIVNFNGAKFLSDCIQSVQENCTNIAYEIIIVDNNSSDNSIHILETEYPNCLLIKNKENYGFAKGNNIGVEHSKGDYLLLLNNDTILLDPILPALDLFNTDPSIGIVGIKMVDKENKFVASFGKFPKFFNFIKLKTLQIDLAKIEQMIYRDLDKPIDVDWISGAFILTKKEIWKQVGGLDESYFMYVEDVDFNKKVQQINKKSVFLPSLRFIHFVGFNKTREKLLISSYMTYIRKHKTGADLMASLFLLNLNLFFKRVFKKV